MKLTIAVDIDVSDEAECKECVFLYEGRAPSKDKCTCVLFGKYIDYKNPKKCQECLDSQKRAMEQLEASGAIVKENENA